MGEGLGVEIGRELPSKRQTAGYEVLKLDIDNGLNEVDMSRIRDIVQILGLQIKELAVYSTNKGYHIYLLIGGSYENHEIVLFQALMGSDYHREAFNYMRVRHLALEGMNGLRSWNVLFQGKATYSLLDMAQVYHSKEIYDDVATRKLLEVLSE